MMKIIAKNGDKGKVVAYGGDIEISLSFLVSPIFPGPQFRMILPRFWMPVFASFRCFLEGLSLRLSYKKTQRTQ